MADTIEEASTGRASCRFCKEKIEKGALRFGERVPSAFGEGEQTLWYHLLCAAERHAEKLSPVLAEFSGEIPDRAKLESIVENGLENPKLASVQKVDHAPTARAKCQHCHEAIAKGDLRVGVDRDTEGQMPAISYIHLGCAPAFLGDAGLETKLLRLSAELSAEERELVARLGAPA
jgi:hypothetical protein